MRDNAVQTYLDGQPPETRRALKRLIAALRAVAPEAEAGTSYGMPAFLYRGRPLAAFAVHKRHCSFYPMSGSVVGDHAKELAGFETSKGAIHFSPGNEIPAAVLKKLVKARVREIEAKG